MYYLLTPRNAFVITYLNKPLTYLIQMWRVETSYKPVADFKVRNNLACLYSSIELGVGPSFFALTEACALLSLGCVVQASATLKCSEQGCAAPPREVSDSKVIILILGCW